MLPPRRSDFGNCSCDAVSVATGPLLPAACALALMPRSAVALAPAPLRPLMLPGSPVADLYDPCDECERLAVLATELGQVRGLA